MRRKACLRVVSRATNGAIKIRDLPTFNTLLHSHTLIGAEDCSLDRSLRGLPVFRDLVGPISDHDQVARYETPEVFEDLTRTWSSLPSPKRRRRAANATADSQSEHSPQSIG